MLEIPVQLASKESACREPKSSGASAEAATVDKSATEARADIALLKRAF